MFPMGVVRGISYGLFGPPDDFGPPARALNANLVRAYLYWGQIEPEPGRYDWTVVDHLLEQVSGSERLWVTVCCSSPWATRTPTSFLPSSPPMEPDAYLRFVTALAERCGDRVRYWQCENEPSNTGLLWSGSAAEYAELATGFAGAVRASSEGAEVVLGGCGYDVLSTAAGSEQWTFFETVCGSARTAFDLFDLHLYDDPRRIGEHFESVRALLRRAGCDQPLIVGEYGGPTIFGFPEAEAAIQEVLAAAAAGGVTPADLQSGAGRETPDRVGMRELYRRLPDLPAELQQFLAGCPEEVAARRDRIACRELVTRNLLAFTEGAVATCYWALAPEVPGYSDPFSLIGLISAKLELLDFRDGELVDGQPAAATFRMLAAAMAGATGVRRIALGDRPEVNAFDVTFADGPGRSLQVLWRDDSDPFTGDSDLHEAFEWHWVHPDLHAADAFAQPVPLPAWASGRLAVPLSATPVLLSTEPLATTGR